MKATKTIIITAGIITFFVVITAFSSYIIGNNF